MADTCETVIKTYATTKLVRSHPFFLAVWQCWGQAKTLPPQCPRLTSHTPPHLHVQPPHPWGLLPTGASLSARPGSELPAPCVEVSLRGLGTGHTVQPHLRLLLLQPRGQAQPLRHAEGVPQGWPPLTAHNAERMVKVPSANQQDKEQPLFPLVSEGNTQQPGQCFTACGSVLLTQRAAAACAF